MLRKIFDKNIMISNKLKQKKIRKRNLSILNDLKKVYPDPDSLYELAKKIVDQNQYNKMVKELYAPDIYDRIGDEYVKIKNYFMAYYCFIKAHEGDPENDIYLSNIGYIIARSYNFKNNDIKQEYARDIFDKAIRINPNNQITWINRCYLEYIFKNYDMALFFCNKAMEINDKNFRIFYNRGLIYFKQGNYELAIKDFIKSIKLNKRYFRAYKNIIKARILKIFKK